MRTTKRFESRWRWQIDDEKSYQFGARVPVHQLSVFCSSLYNNYICAPILMMMMILRKMIMMMVKRNIMMMMVDFAKLRHTSITCQSRGWRIWPAIEWAWIMHIFCNVFFGMMTIVVRMMMKMMVRVIIIIIMFQWNIMFSMTTAVQSSPPLCKDPVGFPTPSTMVITLKKFQCHCWPVKHEDAQAWSYTHKHGHKQTNSV